MDLLPERAPGAQSSANKQELAERLKLCFIQMRTGVYMGGGQGLPQASPAPLVHIEDTAGTLAFTQVTEHMKNSKTCETQ